LPEYRNKIGDTGSFVANPYMPGVIGWQQGWQKIMNSDFDGFFATNPKVILRGIGLQPEAFRDFHFWKTDWLYDKEWAGKVEAGLNAAEGLATPGKNSEAVTAFIDLAKMSMSDRLKSDVLDRAAQCAARMKDYGRAMELAKSIPLAPFAIRRQMAVLVEQKKFADLIKTFSNQAMASSPHLAWFCPETEEVMADGLYFRGIAYAETGDLKAAETDIRTMVDKGNRLVYSPGDTVLAVAWKRLGDFYRTRLKDDAKALEAYRKALEAKSNPEIRDVLKAAAGSAADILRKQGRNEEARKLEQADR